MPTALDFGYLAFLFVLVTLFEGLVALPRFKAAVLAGVPDARRKGYRRTALGQWLFTIVVLVAWPLANRSFTALGVGRDKYRAAFASLGFLLPHTEREYHTFVALSITAGICEELLCRGYMMWVLRPYMNLPSAIALSAVVFGLGHAYQGAKGILKTAGVGIVMNLIVVASGWLIPAMVVHALIDATSGMLAYTVLRDQPVEVLNGAA